MISRARGRGIGWYECKGEGAGKKGCVCAGGSMCVRVRVECKGKDESERRLHEFVHVS